MTSRRAGDRGSSTSCAPSPPRPGKRRHQAGDSMPTERQPPPEAKSAERCEDGDAAAVLGVSSLPDRGGRAVMQEASNHAETGDAVAVTAGLTRLRPIWLVAGVVAVLAAT